MKIGWKKGDRLAVSGATKDKRWISFTGIAQADGHCEDLGPITLRCPDGTLRKAPSRYVWMVYKNPDPTPASS